MERKKRSQRHLIPVEDTLMGLPLNTTNEDSCALDSLASLSGLTISKKNKKTSRSRILNSKKESKILSSWMYSSKSFMQKSPTMHQKLRRSKMNSRKKKNVKSKESQNTSVLSVLQDLTNRKDERKKTSTRRQKRERSRKVNQIVDCLGSVDTRKDNNQNGYNSLSCLGGNTTGKNSHIMEGTNHGKKRTNRRKNSSKNSKINRHRVSINSLEDLDSNSNITLINKSKNSRNDKVRLRDTKRQPRKGSLRPGDSLAQFEVSTDSAPISNKNIKHRKDNRRKKDEHDYRLVSPQMALHEQPENCNYSHSHVTQYSIDEKSIRDMGNSKISDIEITIEDTSGDKFDTPNVLIRSPFMKDTDVFATQPTVLTPHATNSLLRATSNFNCLIQNARIEKKKQHLNKWISPLRSDLIKSAQNRSPIVGKNGFKEKWTSPLRCAASKTLFNANQANYNRNLSPENKYHLMTPPLHNSKKFLSPSLHISKRLDCRETPNQFKQISFCSPQAEVMASKKFSLDEIAVQILPNTETPLSVYKNSTKRLDTRKTPLNMKLYGENNNDTLITHDNEGSYNKVSKKNNQEKKHFSGTRGIHEILTQENSNYGRLAFDCEGLQNNSKDSLKTADNVQNISTKKMSVSKFKDKNQDDGDISENYHSDHSDHSDDDKNKSQSERSRGPAIKKNEIMVDQFSCESHNEGFILSKRNDIFKQKKEIERNDSPRDNLDQSDAVSKGSNKLAISKHKRGCAMEKNNNCEVEGDIHQASNGRTSLHEKKVYKNKLKVSGQGLIGIHHIRDSKKSTTGFICSPKKNQTNKEEDLENEGGSINYSNMKAPTLDKVQLRRSSRQRQPTQRLTFVKGHEISVSGTVHNLDADDELPKSGSKVEDLEEITDCENIKSSKSEGNKTKSKPKSKKNTTLETKLLQTVIRATNRAKEMALKRKTKTINLDSDWSAKEEEELLRVKLTVNPESQLFWHEVASHLDGRNAAECRDKWFLSMEENGDTATSTAKINNQYEKRTTHISNVSVFSKGSPSDEEDDIFDSTPLRFVFHKRNSTHESDKKKQSQKKKPLEKSSMKKMMITNENTDEDVDEDDFFDSTPLRNDLPKISKDKASERKIQTWNYSRSMRLPCAFVSPVPNNPIIKIGNCSPGTMLSPSKHSPLLVAYKNKGYIKKIKRKKKMRILHKTNQSKKGNKGFLSAEVYNNGIKVNAQLTPKGTFRLNAPTSDEEDDYGLFDDVLDDNCLEG